MVARKRDQQWEFGAKTPINTFFFPVIGQLKLTEGCCNYHLIIHPQTCTWANSSHLSHFSLEPADHLTIFSRWGTIEGNEIQGINTSSQMVQRSGHHLTTSSNQICTCIHLRVILFFWFEMENFFEFYFFSKFVLSFELF